MSVIEAAAMRCRTMADGSLRIECEVEPRHAQAAFALFGAPGTPMALAALKTAVQQESAPEPMKGGPLSQWVAMRCQESAFQSWLASTYLPYWCSLAGTPAECAAATIRSICEIESRAEIDNDEGAYERFQERIRGPWQKHCIATGVTA